MDLDSITFDGDGSGGDRGDGGGDRGGDPDEQGSGEWVVELVDRLDEKGMLDAILFGPENAAKLDQGNAPERSVEQDGDGEPIDADAIDADAIASLGKKIIDTAGDRKISEIVYMAEQRPEQVNQLINEHMEGEG
jgi:hypothetical protein